MVLHEYGATMLGYTCLILNYEDRQRLMARFPPEYQHHVAHHITIAYGVDGSTMPDMWEGFIVGDAYDKGVQALVVEINGNTVRPDGAHYHITWSLDEGRFPDQSIALLNRGWFPLADGERIPVSFTPAFVLSKSSRTK
jgi:hypothetical protein